MNWFKSKKARTRFLWTSSVVLLFICCSVFVYISLQYTGKYCDKLATCWFSSSINTDKLAEDKCKLRCNSEACILSASVLQTYMNSSVDPCENFYSFSCGNFLENFGDNDNYTILKIIMNSLMPELKDILNNAQADPETATGKMKISYDSCMDIGSSEHQAVPSALEFLRKVGIPWPNVPPNFEFNNPNLPTVLGNMAAYKEYPFMEIIKVSDDVYNISAIQGKSFFERSEASVVKNLLQRVLKYFEIDGERAMEVWETMVTITNVSKTFDRYFVSVCYNLNIDTVHVNCAEDENNEWEYLCETVEAFVYEAFSNNSVSKTKLVISCADILLLNEINNVIANMSHRSIADFLAMNFFLSHLEDLSFYFRLTKQQDPQAHDEYKPIPIDRYERCLQWTIQNMVMALAYEYTTEFLPESALEEVLEIIEAHINELENLISEQNWLTDGEKSYIIDKIKNVIISTDLLMEFCRNKTYVDNYYKDYHPTSGSFLKNILKHQKAYFSSEIFQKQKNNLIYLLEPFTVNAYIYDILLEIGLPNLRLPLYHQGRPKLINLMSLAITTGHEIGHTIWSDLRTLAQHNEVLNEILQSKIHCFIKQYSNYTIETINKNVHANSSLSENVPDNIGITLLDRLIDKYVTSDDIYSLPGLPYSAKQLIYITASQFWCSKTSKQRDESRYIVNPHIPENLRIIGMLHNSKQFSQAFNCPEASYMNPASKCTLLDSSEAQKTA